MTFYAQIYIAAIFAAILILVVGAVTGLFAASLRPCERLRNKKDVQDQSKGKPQGNLTISDAESGVIDWDENPSASEIFTRFVRVCSAALVIGLLLPAIVARLEGVFTERDVRDRMTANKATYSDLTNSCAFNEKNGYLTNIVLTACFQLTSGISNYEKFEQTKSNVASASNDLLAKYLEPVLNFLQELSVLCIYIPALSLG